MKSPLAIVRGTRAFVGEVQQELKKCSWPTRGELVQSTIVVLVSCAIMAVFVGASDLVLVQALRLLIR